MKQLKFDHRCSPYWWEQRASIFLLLAFYLIFRENLSYCEHIQDRSTLHSFPKWSIGSFIPPFFHLFFLHMSHRKLIYQYWSVLYFIWTRISSKISFFSKSLKHWLNLTSLVFIIELHKKSIKIWSIEKKVLFMHLNYW